MRAIVKLMALKIFFVYFTHNQLIINKWLIPKKKIQVKAPKKGKPY